MFRQLWPPQSTPPPALSAPGVLRRPGVGGVPRQHGGALEGTQRQWPGDEVGGGGDEKGWEGYYTILILVNMYIYTYIRMCV